MSESKKPSVSSSSFSSSARSLDDDDKHVPEIASAASTLGVVHDPHAAKLCASLPILLEQLKKLADSRDDRVSRFAEKPGANIYEVSLDRARGILSVTCLQEKVEGLDASMTEARESLAHEIAQRKLDIAGLEQEVAKLGRQIQDSEGEGVEAIMEELRNVHAMIGKHRKILKELEGKSEVEVKVKVQRVKTCVELVKTETSSEEQETRMVPHRDAGIYVLCGKTNGSDKSSILNTVERYDANLNKWEAVASMNCKRVLFASAVLDDTIYAVGGIDDKGTQAVERFSSRSGRWELTDLSAQLAGCAAGALNGRVYVAGGFESDGKGLSSVISFKPGANRMHELAPMTYRRSMSAGAVLDGFFYVVGGLDTQDPLITVERYDPARNTWELVAPMNRKRATCAAAACNGYLYALGGCSDTKTSQPLSSVERFDPRLNRWEEVASMQQARAALAAVALDGRLYAIGGVHISQGGNIISDCASVLVERYDPVTNQWEQMAPMSTARAFASAVVAP